MKKNNYVFYLDFLRVLSMFAVIILHVAAQNFEKVTIGSFAWNVFNITDSLVRWSVPILIMISGVFFLDNDRELSLKKLFSHNILRLFIILIFWSFIYALDEYLKSGSIKYAFSFFITGKYHLWFLNMILGLYLITPILRRITNDKKSTEYLLIVSLILSIVIPTILDLLKFIPGEFVTNLISDITVFFDKTYIKFGYLFYYVLGYYLHKYKFSKNVSHISYILGILGGLVTIILTDLYSRKLGVAKAIFYTNFNIGVMLMSVGLFLFIKNIFSKKKYNKVFVSIVKLFSSCSLGMYLVHLYVLEKLNDWGKINTLSYNPILSMILVFGITTIISFVFVFSLKQIPIVKKYIV